MFEAIFGPDHKKERLDRDLPNLNTIQSSATRILGVRKGGSATAPVPVAARQQRQRGSRALVAGFAAAGRRQ
jgi:hypothetical protein